MVKPETTTETEADDNLIETVVATPVDPDEKSDMVVVANRLPFDLEVNDDGSTTARQSPGGLVTALEPILSRRHGAWIGWPGTPDVDLPSTRTDNLILHPVRLSTEEVDQYYEGFSNATLWPLYHDAVQPAEFHREWWDAYQRVNRRFAERAAEVAAEGATVWVHDYQLQLVPQFLRELRPDVQIGFFLHIPFPPQELFHRLPWRSQLISGLLGSDLIGFQLPGGARNFARLAKGLLGVSSAGGRLHVGGRSVRIGSFPISIDSSALSTLAATPAVHDAARKLREDLGNPSKIILGVDRLDYTKGIDVRLQAFEELLAEEDPAAQDAVMIQIATPSRERLNTYVQMRENIERQVGALNGNYGRIGRPGVHYLHQSLPREDLAAFYVAADVMMVTPLRDGMNLVAKEYVASRVDGGGVLVLSEFTGAARELRAATLVNPYDTDGVKEALRAALTTPSVEARRRMRTLRRQVLGHDVNRWAADFLKALEGGRDLVAEAEARLPAEVLDSLHRVATADRLLVGTDFDGVLAPIVDDPAAARPRPEALASLHQLAGLSSTGVAVISGRALDLLPTLLGGGDLGDLSLIGSHGAESAAGDGPVELTADQAARLQRLRRSLQGIVAGRANIRLEPKPTGVAVHFRLADPEDAAAVTAAIEDDPASWQGIHLLRGKQVLELSVLATDKGRAISRLAAAQHATSVVFFGDDVTDESVFITLEEGDLGVKVGPGDTAARVRVADPEQVEDALRVLAAARRKAVRKRSKSAAEG